MLWIGLACWTSACGREASGPAPAQPGLNRLDLQPQDQRPLEPIVSFRSWDAADPEVDWRPRAAKVTMVESPHDAERASLVMHGEGARRLILNGPFEPGAFDHVRLAARPGGRDSIQVFVQGAGGEQWQGPRVPFSIESPGELFGYDLSGLRERPLRVARVVLTFGGQTPSTSIAAIELLRYPRAHRLPDAADGERFLELGDESRPCVGLAAERPLSTRFRLPDRLPAGAQLDLAFGQSPELRSAQARPEVLIRIAATGKTLIEQRLPLPPPPTAGQWTDTRLDLTPLAGSTAELSISLENAPGSVAAIATPLLRLPMAEGAAPTLVLITSDTHRGDHLGAAESGVEIQTPFLDGLAARGVLFEDAWAPCNITRPSHSSLLTGTLVDAHGVTTNRMPLSGEATTLAEVLGDRGWLNFAAVSTLLLGEPQSGTGQGFDRVGSPRIPHRRSTATIELLRSWLPQAEGVPLFVWLHLYDAHGPYEVPAAWERLYYPPGRDPTSPDLPELPAGAQPRWSEDVRDPAWFAAQYRSEITFLDAQLAELFELPRFARATVAFTADHGEALDERQLQWRHTQLYPNTLHVPLVLAGPGIASGERDTRPVMIRDVGRTLLNRAGLREVEFPGRDLLTPEGAARVDESGAEPRFAIGSGALHASAQLGPWYLFLHLAEDEQLDSPPPAHTVELYDLSEDPHCLRNVLDANLETAGELRAALLRWLSNFRAPAESDPQQGLDLDVLAELGYQGAASAGAASVHFDPDCRCERCQVFD